MHYKRPGHSLAGAARPPALVLAAAVTAPPFDSWIPVSLSVYRPLFVAAVAVVVVEFGSWTA